jgi:hypothetical protein
MPQLAELLHHAMASVIASYSLGAQKGYGDRWLQVSVSTHLHHARDHIDAYLAGRHPASTGDSDHLQQALCRLAMAVYLERKAAETAVEEPL